MGRKANIQTTKTFSVLLGPAASAQSRQFPGITVRGDNPEQAAFVFRQQAKGSRRAMYRRPSGRRQD